MYTFFFVSSHSGKCGGMTQIRLQLPNWKWTKVSRQCGLMSLWDMSSQPCPCMARVHSLRARQTFQTALKLSPRYADKVPRFNQPPGKHLDVISKGSRTRAAVRWKTLCPQLPHSPSVFPKCWGAFHIFLL